MQQNFGDRIYLKNTVFRIVPVLGGVIFDQVCRGNVAKNEASSLISFFIIPIATIFSPIYAGFNEEKWKKSAKSYYKAEFLRIFIELKLISRGFSIILLTISRGFSLKFTISRDFFQLKPISMGFFFSFFQQFLGIVRNFR